MNQSEREIVEAELKVAQKMTERARADLVSKGVPEEGTAAWSLVHASNALIASFDVLLGYLAKGD